MTFEDLDLIEPICKALVQEGYTTPTPIQSEAIPIVSQGYDLLGCAQTGTGKTAAFSIPIIQRLYLQKKKGYKRGIKALILTPTRELAIQIGESFAAYGRFAGLRHTVIFGGVGQKPQTEALERGIDILIATPGRLLDLIGQGFIHLDTLEYFVLDEADRMLDMGFIHDIKRILPLLPKKRQSLFFSATMPPEIERLAGTILSEPQKVEVTPASSTVDAIDQSVYFVEKAEKINLLKSLLENSELESVLIFTRTKHGADKVARVLSKAEIGAEAIHGNKSQTARQRALTNFKDHTYVHRIGRTGRAGREGVAFSFCDAEEVPLLKDIQKLIGKEVPVAGGHMYETKEVKAAIAEKKEAIKQESKRRNMFGSKRDGSYWRNKKRAANSSK